jgi:hypothetical protein
MRSCKVWLIGRSRLDPAYFSYLGNAGAKVGSNPFDHIRGGHFAIRTVAFDPQEHRSGLLLELNQLDGRFGDVEQRSEIDERFANATVDVAIATLHEHQANAS